MAAVANEQENERRVVNWLGVIALAVIGGIVFLTNQASKTKIGIDTAVIVAMIGIVAQCASSLGTRRTRIEPTLPGGTTIDPTVTMQHGDSTITLPASMAGDTNFQVPSFEPDPRYSDPTTPPPFTGAT